MIVFLCALLTQADQSAQDLIDRLEDESLELRDRAQAELIRRGEAILADLREARKKAQGERAKRLDAILTEILWWERTVWVGRRAVDARKGTVMWELKTEFKSTVVVDRDVVVGYRDGRVERRSLRDGAVLWEVPASDNADELWSSAGFLLQIVGDKVRGIDASSGRVLWTAEVDRSPRVSAQRLHAAAGRAFIVGANESTCLETSSGKKRWSVPGECRAGRVLPDGDVVVVSKDSIGRYAGSDGTRRWSVACRRDQEWNLWIAGETAVAGDSRGSDGTETRLYHLASGKVLRTIAGYPIAAEAVDSDVFVATASRTLLRIAPSSGTGVWSHSLQMEGAALVREGDRLYLAEYEPISCGVAIRCLSSSSGELLWRGEARGIQVDHSKYRHTASLRLLPDAVVLLGDSSGGVYVETFGKTSGQVLTRWRSDH